MHFHCISLCWEAWISTAPDPKKNKYVKLKLLVTHWNVIMLIPIDKLSNVLSTFGCACRVGKPSWNFMWLSSVKISLSSLHRDVSMRSIMWYKKKKSIMCAKWEGNWASIPLWNVNVVGKVLLVGGIRGLAYLWVELPGIWDEMLPR